MRPSAAERSVRDRLRALWGRRLAATALDRLGLALLAVSTTLLVAGVYRFWQGAAPFAADLAWNVLGATLCGATIYTLGSLTPIDETASWIDRHARTHDRFHTALAFAARPELTPMQALTLAECVRFVADFPVRRWTPVRLPRTCAWATVPLVSLALLAWHASLRVGQPPRDPALAAVVAGRADALQTIAARLRREDPRTPSPERDQLAEAMKQSARRLRDSQGQADEARRKTALGELSSLEAMLAAMKQAAKDEKISPGELAALAAALAATPPTREAGEAVRQGRLEQAGDQLQKLAEEMKSRGSDSAGAWQQLAQSMQEQVAKLSDREQNEVARQMQQAAQSAQNGQAQLSARAMERLAELLKKSGQNGGGSARRQASSQTRSGSGSLSDKQLQDLLNALENEKEGLQPGDGAGQPPEAPDGGDEGKQSLAVVESFANKRGGDPVGGEKPSGLPGGEHDSGTNEHLLADHAPAPPRGEGPAKRLEGRLGEGATLQELVGASSGPARAGRPYRDLFRAIAPAEQNSVEHEDIPLGARFFVRRYFENIRPQD